MEARITVHGDHATGPGGLLEWLRHEPQLRGYVREQPRAARPDAMGVPVDIVLAALGGGGAVRALAHMVRTWLQQRKSDVRIEIETPLGRASVSVTDTADPGGIVSKLMPIMDAPPTAQSKNGEPTD